jgi:hypothetical protein
MGREQIAGAWSLVSTEHRRSDGTVVYPFGKNASGLIIYTADGYMSVHIAGINRPRFAAGSRLDGTPEEIKGAFETYLAYWGTYDIDDKAQTIVHRVQGGLLPDDAGSMKKRRYELSGNSLSLFTSPVQMKGFPVTGVMVWKRVSPVP